MMSLLRYFWPTLLYQSQIPNVLPVCVLCTHIAFASDIYLLGSLQREAPDEVKMQTSKLFHIVKEGVG